MLCMAAGQVFGAAKKLTAERPRTRELRLKQKLVEKLDRELPGEGNVIESIFSDPRLAFLPSAPLAAKKPEKKRRRGVNYYFQEPTFLLSEESWRRGREYMEKHAAAFALADETKKTSGVPKEIITAILRVETYLGKGLGDNPETAESYFNRGVGVHPAVNIFYTFYIKGRRQKSVNPEKQITCLIKICLENGWDIFAIPGSSAGAIGIPQFMPTSYANPRLVADGDGDGKINLFRHEDAIMSVATYLRYFGWGDAAASRKKAIRAYNKESAYVEAVLVYGELLKRPEYDKEYVKRFAEPRQSPKKKKHSMSKKPNLRRNKRGFFIGAFV